MYIDTNVNVKEYQFDIFKQDIKAMGWRTYTNNDWTWYRNDQVKSNIDIIITKDINPEYVNVDFQRYNKELSDHKPI